MKIFQPTTGGGGGGGVSSVTASLPLTSSGGATPNIALNIGTGLSVVGTNLVANKQVAFLTNNTVNGSQSLLNLLNGTGITMTEDGSGDVTINSSGLSVIISDSPLSGDGTSGSHLMIAQADTATDGYLSSTDWNTFNNKIGGLLTPTRIPYATASDTLGDDATFLFNPTNKALVLGDSHGNTIIATSPPTTPSGFSNTIVGAGAAGSQLTSGSSNTIYGAAAGQTLDTANNNAFFGVNAGVLATGDGNTIFGTGFGGLSNQLTTGMGNSVLGYNIGWTAGTESNSAAIGNGAIITASNQFMIGATGSNGITKITAPKYPSTRDDTGSFTPISFLYTDISGNLLVAPLISTGFLTTVAVTSPLAGDGTVGTPLQMDLLENHLYVGNASDIASDAGSNFTYDINNDRYTIAGPANADLGVFYNGPVAPNGLGAHKGVGMDFYNSAEKYTLGNTNTSQLAITVDNVTSVINLSSVYANTRDDSGSNPPVSALYTNASGDLLSAPIAKFFLPGSFLIGSTSGNTSAPPVVSGSETFLGSQAGSGMSTNNTTAIGVQAGKDATNATGSTFIGVNSGFNGLGAAGENHAYAIGIGVGAFANTAINTTLTGYPSIGLGNDVSTGGFAASTIIGDAGQSTDNYQFLVDSTTYPYRHIALASSIDVKFGDLFARGNTTIEALDDINQQITQQTSYNGAGGSQFYAAQYLTDGSIGNTQIGDISGSLNSTLFILDDVAQTYTFNKLATGGANQMVTADTNGVLGIQAIPGGATIENVSLPNQSADIGATSFTTNTPGLYRLSWYLVDSAADLTAGAVTATFTYTDSATGKTVNSSAVLLTTIGAYTQGSIYLQLASGNIQYAINHTGIFGTATYNLSMTLEKLN